MSYQRERKGDRGLHLDAPADTGIVSPSPGFPFPGMPGSLGPMPGPGASPTPVGPSQPARLFPTSGLRPGDVVNVTGPFAGLIQGQVRVKFAGAPWMAPQLTSAFGGSVVVPQRARTGECLIEVNGRQVYGTQCHIVAATGPRAAPREHQRSWRNFGDKSHMGSYVPAGAIPGTAQVSISSATRPSSVTAFTTMALRQSTPTAPTKGTGIVASKPSTAVATFQIKSSPDMVAYPIAHKVTEHPTIAGQTQPGRPAVVEQPPPAVSPPTLTAPPPPNNQFPPPPPSGGGGSSVAYPGGTTDAEYADAELHELIPPPAPAPPTQPKKLSTGAIIGLAAGGALLVYLLTR